METLSRRRLLLCSSGCAAAAICMPRSSEAYGEPINIGDPTEFEVDSISEKFIRHNFFILRREKRLYTIVATCPHKENYLFQDPSNPKEISCSGHDAYFDLDGSPLSGPVKKGLVRFKVTRDEKGHVFVDPFTQFPENKWDAKDSYIAIE